MEFDTALLKWTRQPRDCRIEKDRVEITTNPHTDLWQNTYYHFCNDNAPVLQMESDEGHFSFVVKIGIYLPGELCDAGDDVIYFRSCERNYVHNFPPKRKEPVRALKITALAYRANRLIASCIDSGSATARLEPVSLVNMQFPSRTQNS